MTDLSRFLDEKSRVKTWPSKKELKYEVLKHVSEKFEAGRFYTEKEVNAIINEWHTFNDYFLLRRGMVDHKLLSRTRSGSIYWKEESIKHKEIAELISQSYAIGIIKSIFKLTANGTPNRYFLMSDSGEYILREGSQEEMLLSENEASIISTIAGEKLLQLENRMFCLYPYVFVNK